MIEIRTNGFYVFRRFIPFYGLLLSAGFAAGILLAIPRAKILKLPFSEVVYSAVFAAIGGILGAKLLCILTSFRYIAEYHLSVIDVIRNGFVFYGGLIGGISGLFLYTKLYQLSGMTYFALYAPSVPLGHALGRIGCLLSGCCFGLPTEGAFSVVYYSAIDGNTPLNTALFPIQLTEAFCLIGIYVVSETVFYTVKKRGAAVFTYLFSYTVCRFILEFFRGDSIRGVYFHFSLSQYISVALFAAGLAFLIYEGKKNRKSARKRRGRSRDP